MIKLFAPIVAFLAAVVAFVSDCINWYPVMQQLVTWLARNFSVAPAVPTIVM